MEGDHPKNMLTCPSIINLFRENTSQRISVKVRIMAYKVIYILVPGPVNIHGYIRQREIKVEKKLRF